VGFRQGDADRISSSLYWGRVAREGLRKMQLPFLTEEMEKGRRVYGGHVSAQRVQPVTADIWRGASKRFGGCEGWYYLEVLKF
jgi:hypothetical protein